MELCARRDEPEHAIQRGLDEEERQAKLREEWRKKNPEDSRKKRMPVPVPGISWHREEPMRPPVADGPLREGSEGFRSAVMETTALNGLIALRPDVAGGGGLGVCFARAPHSTPNDPRPLLDNPCI